MPIKDFEWEILNWNQNIIEGKMEITHVNLLFFLPVPINYISLNVAAKQFH